jgi:uncharacterized membrane protein
MAMDPLYLKKSKPILCQVTLAQSLQKWKQGMEKTEPSSVGLIPKHTFHPALVHFPIALLAMAAFFEPTPKKRDTEFLHKASVLNLSIGSSGQRQQSLQGFLLGRGLAMDSKAVLLIHLILASTSILV